MYSGPPLWCLPLEAVIGTASNLVLNVGVGRERGPSPWVVQKERRVEEKIRKARLLSTVGIFSAQSHGLLLKRKPT